MLRLLLIAACVAIGGLAPVATAQTPKLDVPPVVPNQIFLVEQVVTGRLPPQVLQQLQPLKTLRQVEELLKANSIPYAWRKAELNSALVPAEVMDQIRKLPPGEPFVMPSGQNLTISVILGCKS